MRWEGGVHVRRPFGSIGRVKSGGIGGMVDTVERNEQSGKR